MDLELSIFVKNLRDLGHFHHLNLILKQAYTGVPCKQCIHIIVKSVFIMRSYMPCAQDISCYAIILCNVHHIPKVSLGTHLNIKHTAKLLWTLGCQNPFHCTSFTMDIPLWGLLEITSCKNEQTDEERNIAQD